MKKIQIVENSNENLEWQMNIALGVLMDDKELVRNVYWCVWFISTDFIRYFTWIYNKEDLNC